MRLQLRWHLRQGLLAESNSGKGPKGPSAAASSQSWSWQVLRCQVMLPQAMNRLTATPPEPGASAAPGGVHRPACRHVVGREPPHPAHPARPAHPPQFEICPCLVPIPCPRPAPICPARRGRLMIHRGGSTDQATKPARADLPARAIVPPPWPRPAPARRPVRHPRRLSGRSGTEADGESACCWRV